MKTFIITVEIEHTDKTFQSPEIQQFIAHLGTPQADWVKQMKKAFKQTVLGDKANDIQVSYTLK